MCEYCLFCVSTVCQTTIFLTLEVWKSSKVETQLRSSWHWSSSWEVWKLDLLWTLTVHFGKNLNFGFLLNFKNVIFWFFTRKKPSSSINKSLSFNLPKLSTNSSSSSQTSTKQQARRMLVKNANVLSFRIRTKRNYPCHVKMCSNLMRNKRKIRDRGMYTYQ